MKRLKGHRMNLVFVGVVGTILLVSRKAEADFTFGEPVHLDPPISNSAGSDAPDFITDDGLTMYFDSWRPSGYGKYDIWVTTRSKTDDPWGEPVNLGPQVNSPVQDICATMTADCLELYFSSYRSGGYGQGDMYVAKRDARDNEWDSPVNLGPTLNGSSDDLTSWISPDGLELYFMANRSGGHGGYDIWITTRATRSDSWESPVNLSSAINSTANEGYPCISEDGLVMFFSEEIFAPFRPDGFGRGDIWMTTRTSSSEPWGTPTNLGPIVNSSSFDGGPRISPDGSTLYFCSARPGSLGGSYGDIYQASIIPIVDFNGDGVLDAADMCIMIDHWGENYSLCDIGPMPWGDGVVDVEDLKVLAEHMGGYQGPIVHWALDEEEGNIAHDKIGQNDASVYGDAAWFPAEGMFGGALLLDGTDDWAFTGPVGQLNSGPFSIIAWAKGWAPDRVLISQAMASNWLMADAAGNLISDIKCTGRDDGPLLSQTIITDGDWHRIALVWDGSRRALYVDGVAVAENVQSGLEISNTGLNFGVGSDYQPGTYWSGMLDDIRIYDVALTTDQIAALAH